MNLTSGWEVASGESVNWGWEAALELVKWEALEELVNLDDDDDDVMELAPAEVKVLQSKAVQKQQLQREQLLDGVHKLTSRVKKKQTNS